MRWTIRAASAAFVFYTASAGAAVRSTTCDDLTVCYKQMDAACGGQYAVVDRSDFYGDVLTPDLPPGFSVGLAQKYSTLIFECR